MSTRTQALNQEAQISLYPEAGHAPFFDEPDRFNRELAAFISDRPSSRIRFKTRPMMVLNPLCESNP